MKNRQRGYLNLPDGFFESLCVLAIVGLLALICLAAWATWWLVTHISITP